MPFSPLLLLYLLFAIVSYDKFELTPLFICTLVGLICGYFDYSRYLIEKNIALAACLLTIVLIGSILILDLNFTSLLILVTLAALSMGSIVSILFHSISTIEKSEGQSRELNQSLTRSNDLLKQEKDSLHIALSEGEKREAELKAMMEKNVQSIWDLSHKNNQLSAQNTRFAINLDNISSEKKSRENDLLSLARSTSLMEGRLQEISQSKQALEQKQKVLISREKELYKEIEQRKSVKHTDLTDKTANSLKIELDNTKKELKKNQQQKSVNAENLASAQQSLATQASEKRALEEQVAHILKKQEDLIVSTERLKIEKESIQKNLNTVQNEINIQRNTNLKNEQTIKDQDSIIKELRINDDFLKKWLDIETLLISQGYASSDSKSVDLINYYHRIGKIDRFLKDDLHSVRTKRNDKTHKLNTKICEYDVKKANECHARLEKCLL
ncbi:hypothetical protein ACT3QO_13090 [Psychrobacter sp. AOP7-D1-15]|uniref:hypothetical protein n=1 Tax=unclassified Psychrobacter TaxID=196806 RepID=UPI0018686FDE|nr:hypothetical protein [Psychrobacter sp. FME61]